MKDVKFKKVTIANLAKVTAQEVFDYVANHLLTQIEKSREVHKHKDVQGLTCAYRGQNGLMCAAGVLFTDAQYKKAGDIEKRAWRDLAENGPVPKHHKDLIATLQSVHDCNEPDEWRTGLFECTNRYGLEFKFRG